ncbi:hypothetical protein C8R44DRAFT_769668 [Mycena epipterygia]|nr:hypothetical protein C8R44DRAFT_769668 [Mycena epipterygia]
MLKKYKNFMNNEGRFEQPGARALQDFINVYNQQLESDRLAQAVRAANARVREAEELAREAEQRAEQAERPSAEEITRLFPETVFSEAVTHPVEPEPTPGSPTCAICRSNCQICPNPWQRTRSDIMVSKVTHISRPKAAPYGIALNPCNHVFCGACLAQAIYHRLNMAFDPVTYGRKLPSYAPDVLSLGRPEFPISCPICQAKMPVEKPIEISDATAQLVLGEPNMDEWNHARFFLTLNLIYCPHQGCNEAFDVDDVVPTQDVQQHPRIRVQCPHCKRALCKACKSVWHENLTCLMYQALPPNERSVDGVRRRVGAVPAQRR